jgi:hypothetical protein
MVVDRLKFFTSQQLDFATSLEVGTLHLGAWPRKAK